MCCSGMAQCYGQHTHVRVTFTEIKEQRRHGYLDFTKFIVVGDVAQSFLFVIVCSMCASKNINRGFETVSVMGKTKVF